MSARDEGPTDTTKTPRRLDARALHVAARRSAFLALVAASVLIASWFSIDMMRMNGTTPLEYVIFGSSILLLVPITMSFWTAVFGFVVQISGHDSLALDVARCDDSRTIEGIPTAIVVPIYEENPERVLAGITATRASLEQSGHLDAFDFFILSDTMNPDRWLEEELAITKFRARLPDPDRLRYRNRMRNTAKKAGNIEDFCLNEGELYRYMIIFDADSVMSGAALVSLVKLMECHPDAGIIQVPPTPVNLRSLFGRLQQFAARAYGPTWATGLAYLQGGEGNYYGHNAIVRIAPFREHCRLPKLSGPAPLGGFLLSHDFVEAALMRRAGFTVHLASGIGGSFEEPPPTLIDYAVRDRRWCQGNLQHARLLSLPGLHPISRVHLTMGVLSYVSAPLWIGILALSTVETLRYQSSEHEYFKPGGSLFPVWEISIQTQASILFASVLLFLFLPRALAVIACLRSKRERRQFGGALSLLASGIFECLCSTLIAPVLGLWQAQSVFSVLLGRNVGWPAQTRGARGTTLREALRRHFAATVIGVSWTALLIAYSPALLGWMAPVLAGLVLAIPVSMISSRVSAGEWAARHALLLTPEEVAPPRVLETLRDELASIQDEPPSAAERGALERVLEDPNVRAAHLAFARRAASDDPLEQHALAGLILKCRLEGPAALSKEEQRRLLLAPDALRELVDQGRLHASA